MNAVVYIRYHGMIWTRRDDKGLIATLSLSSDGGSTSGVAHEVGVYLVELGVEELPALGGMLENRGVGGLGV